MKEQKIKDTNDQFEEIIAVYGTLRKKGSNHRYFLNNDFSELLSEERITLPLMMIDLGGFPALINSPDQNQISFEIYKITNRDVSKSIEALEGYPDFYNKVVIETKQGPANVYVISSGIDDFNFNVIHSGDWIIYSKSELVR